MPKRNAYSGDEAYRLYMNKELPALPSLSTYEAGEASEECITAATEHKQKLCLDTSKNVTKLKKQYDVQTTKSPRQRRKMSFESLKISPLSLTASIESTLQKMSPSSRISDRSRLLGMSPARSDQTSIRSSGMDFMCQGLSAFTTLARNASVSDQARAVIVKIMCSLASLDDMKNLASTNKVLYNIYRLNCKRIQDHILRNISLAAFEFCCWRVSSPTQDDLRFVICFREEWYQGWEVVMDLRALIKEKCSEQIRPETLAGLQDERTLSSFLVSETLWRIWTFCELFKQKNRQKDLVAQIDWLDGGILANDFSCSAVGTPMDSFDADSILVDAPAYFAVGNSAGLSIEELLCISEIWDCIAMLLEPYHNQTLHAQRYGVFAKCGAGYIACSMLEEWIIEMSQSGLSTVLKLAQFSDDTESGFLYACAARWTQWKPKEKAGSSFLIHPLRMLHAERLKLEDNTHSSNAGSIESAHDKRHTQLLKVNYDLPPNSTIQFQPSSETATLFTRTDRAHSTAPSHARHPTIDSILIDNLSPTPSSMCVSPL